jgi:hypothetical protein
MKIGTAICLILLAAAPTLVFAQDTTQPPIARPPAPQAPGSQATTTLTRDTWRRTMARTPFPKAGCYTASYPSTQWQEVPCSTAKAVPHAPATEPKPHNVGGGGATPDYSAQVKKSLSSATGSFDSVIGATGESDSQAGNENFSLQLNTNTFTPSPSSLCDNPKCYAFQQFIYDSPGNVYIQYWLVNHGSTCPTQTVPNTNSTWSYSPATQPGAAAGCFINGHQTPVPTQTITELAGLRLTGNNSPGDHSVKVEISAGTQYGGLDDGDFLGIGTQWNIAEFNVFGAGNSSTAVLTPNPGTTIVVRTSVDNGTTNAPTCFQGVFTNEQNSLNPVKVSPCCQIGGASPAIIFTESNTSSATSLCACQAGFAWDPDAAACVCTPKTTAQACGKGQCAGSVPDGCGGTISCPSNCPSGETCNPLYGNGPCCQPPIPGQILPNQCAPVCPLCPVGYRCAVGTGEATGYCVVDHLCPRGTHYCAGEPTCLPGEPGTPCVQPPPPACAPLTPAQACGTAKCTGDVPDGCGGTIACPTNCPSGEVCSGIATNLCCAPPIPGRTVANQCPSPGGSHSCGNCNPSQGKECCTCNGGVWDTNQQCLIPCSPTHPCNTMP